MADHTRDRQTQGTDTREERDVGETDTRKAEAYTQVSTNPGVGDTYTEKHDTEIEEGKKHGKIQIKRLNEGKTGPQEIEREK